MRKPGGLMGGAVGSSSIGEGLSRRANTMASIAPTLVAVRTTRWTRGVYA